MRPHSDLAPGVRTSVFRDGYFGSVRLSAGRSSFHAVLELAPVLLILVALVAATTYSLPTASAVLGPESAAWLHQAARWAGIPETPAPAKKRQAAAKPQLGVGSVLVIESDSELRLVATTALSRQGYTVRLAENGKEALRIFGAADDISLVILATGPEARRTRKEIQSLQPDMKIVVAKKPGTYTFAGLKASATIPRPYDAPQLMEAVRKAVSEAGGKARP
jgi:CheY-like chemotaxis protein